MEVGAIPTPGSRPHLTAQGTLLEAPPYLVFPPSTFPTNSPPQSAWELSLEIIHPQILSQAV